MMRELLIAWAKARETSTCDADELRAILDRLRTPSEAMMEAGNNILPGGFMDVFEAMIDAALAETPGGPD